ncbi:hypothetical protein [Dysgonomonas alginatilytica]|uniref:hypothetical protein n=1 Tax=Dysgonomonas alginatilytica TaxID=1605892 RepID=UPI0011B5A768|nr:hypothetical protein [Dysgonomonas alginatilytica]
MSGSKKTKNCYSSILILTSSRTYLVESRELLRSCKVRGCILDTLKTEADIARQRRLPDLKWKICIENLKVPDL